MAVDKSLSIAYRVLRDAQNKYAEGGSVQNDGGIPELRSYGPTVRDRIASYLIGNQRPSPERRGFVQGLMGSSGLGNQGMGLVDFTPAGIPMQAQEGYREGGPRDAALAIFAGPAARTADRVALSAAQKLKATGAPREQIWKDTGWFEGADGKWRFEIPDNSARLSGATEPGQLKKHIEHPEVFNAYPYTHKDETNIGHSIGGMGDIFVRTEHGRGDSKSSAGNYWIDPKSPLLSERIGLFDKKKETLLHEMQHAIQKREGFVSGANPNLFINEDKRKLLTLQEELNYLVPRIEGTSPSSPEYQNLIDRHRAIVQQVFEITGQDGKAIQQRASQNYTKTAGEVEARNVERRMNMTPEQRKENPPWTTQDVPDKQQIVTKPGIMEAAIPKAPIMTTPPIRAYHASPYDFDKFDLSKIGTGEGAQAYGHGLYFAESPKVMEEYWKEFVARKRGNNIDSMPNTVGGQQFDEYNPLHVAADYLRGFKNNKERAITAAQLDRKFGDKKFYDQVIGHIEKGAAPADPLAHRYEVNIHADPNKFLDWDAPLSRQSQDIMKALEPLGIKSQKEELRSFDDALLNQLTGDGSMPLPKQPRDPMGSELYRGSGSVFQSTSDPVKSKAFLEAGIPGIKYLDQGSRTAGDGTRNYVVFDPNIIEILRKYGIAGIPAAGVAAGAMNNGDGEMKFASGGSTPFYTRSEARNLERSGLINTPTGGRADKHPLGVKGGSYVLSADIVSALGQGNTLAGAKALDQLFKMGPYGTEKPRLRGRSRSVKGFAHGGTVEPPVDIAISGGEYVVEPEQVAALGEGNMEVGHEVLDALVKQVRSQTIKHLKKLPSPKKG